MSDCGTPPPAKAAAVNELEIIFYLQWERQCSAVYWAQYSVYCVSVRAAQYGGPELRDPGLRGAGQAAVPHLHQTQHTGPVSYTHLTLPTKRIV